MTQHCLHIGLIPAMNTFSQVVSDLGRQMQVEGGGAEGGGGDDRKVSILRSLNVVSWWEW
jgi:hypothetical protein